MNKRQRKEFYVKGGVKKYRNRWSDSVLIRECVGVAKRRNPTGRLEDVHVYGDPINGSWYWAAITLPDNHKIKIRVAKAIYRENAQRSAKGLIF